MYLIQTNKGDWITVRAAGLQQALRRHYIIRVIWFGYTSYMEREI